MVDNKDEQDKYEKFNEINAHFAKEGEEDWLKKVSEGSLYNNFCALLGVVFCFCALIQFSELLQFLIGIIYHLVGANYKPWEWSGICYIISAVLAYFPVTQIYKDLRK